MTLLTKKAKKPTEPAVHVLVIAVGNYPYLDQGSSKRGLIPNGGLGQLKSPITSAEVMCRWLQSAFRPKKLPLGSIEVLCSAGGKFQDDQGQEVAVSAPTMKNARKAIDSWAARGDEHEDNFLIHYFCGHGVSTGIVHSLLLEDFGHDKNDPFNTGAIDADGFMDGLRTKAARSQLFLFDACRTVEHSAFPNFGAQRGAAIVSAPPNARLGIVEQACLWATSLGAMAYGKPGQESVFMGALLHAMQGGGAMQDANDGRWVIQPDVLKRAIDHIIQRIPHFAASGSQYSALERMVRGFPVHALAGVPSVPVKVQCNPASRNSVTAFECSSGDKRPMGPPEPWHLDLPLNPYTFAAIAAEGTTKIPAMPHPPFSIVSFDHP
jgi:hypothetical protein